MSLGYDELATACPEQVCIFTFESADWTALRGDLTTSKTLGEGGLGLTADLVLVVPLAQFAEAEQPIDPPAEKDLLTVDSVDYHVGPVTKDHAGEFEVLALYDASKGV